MSLLRKIWNRTGRRFIRRVDMDVMRRPLSLPNIPMPKGRRSALREDDDFYMVPCTHEIVDSLRHSFPQAKITHFHQMVDRPDVDFVIRMRDDGECWGFMMHAMQPLRDPHYRMTIPLAKNEVYQFDGWVHPDYRGRMVAIQGTNWVFDRRRADGTEAVVVTVRKQDKTAQKYHRRFGFEQIGAVVHWRVGPFRFNRVEMLPRDQDGSPSGGPDPAGNAEAGSPPADADAQGAAPQREAQRS